MSVDRRAFLQGLAALAMPLPDASLSVDRSYLWESRGSRIAVLNLWGSEVIVSHVITAERKVLRATPSGDVIPYPIVAEYDLTAK